MIDSRRVYEDLVRIAAQLSLCLPDSHGHRRLQKIMRRNQDATSWTHCLIQLELAGLALRQGWAFEFEQMLSVGTPGDIRLERDGHAIAIEVTSVGMSDAEQTAAVFFHLMTTLLLRIEMQYGVYIQGSVGDVVPTEERETWIAEIAAAAQATAQDREVRFVEGPAEAGVWVGVEESRPDETYLEGPGGATNVWSRLDARINLKGRKTAGSGPMWIRLQEYAGLWLSMLQSNMTFVERVAAIVPDVRAMMSAFPHVRGIILSPAPVWLTGDPGEQTIMLPGAVGLRRPFALGRARELIIISQADEFGADGNVFLEWYGNEATWLAWALEKLGQPSPEVLFR